MSDSKITDSDFQNSRWKGVTRPYTDADVEKLRGSLKIEHTIAQHGARKLWELLNTEDFVNALGALTGNQAVQMVKAGLKAIYLDTGSGAPRTVAPDMVKAVRQAVDLPIIVGGGIRSAEQAQALCEAGADMLVVGTAFEEDPERVFALREAVG